MIICILALCGCSGFLEEYSQDKSYIKGYDDLDEILLGNAYFERFYVSNGWQFSGIAGENYLPCLHVMSDELAQQTRGSSWVAEGACGTIYGYHTWQYRVYENLEGKTAWDDAADFRHLYSHINACNIILEEIKAYEDVTEEEDVQNVNRIKGESYSCGVVAISSWLIFTGAPTPRLQREMIRLCRSSCRIVSKISIISAIPCRRCTSGLWRICWRQKNI